MTQFRHVPRRRLRFGFCAFFVVVSMALPAQRAAAQLPDSLAGVGGLLQALGQMQQRGSGLSLDSGRFPSPLDTSRSRSTPTTTQQPGVGATSAQVLGREAAIQRRNMLQVACAGTTPLSEDAMRSARAAGEISDVEADYCLRVGQPISQFGYDTFSSLPSNDPGNPLTGGAPPRANISGAIQEDYRLGPGDELVITIVGPETRVVTTSIDTEGRAQIPQMRPIPAAGRTLAEFKRDLVTQLSLSMPRAEVLVSVGAIRSVRVTIAGEVARPGLHALSGLSSAFDALQAAGGVKKSGSLRRVRLERRSHVTWIDMYDLLLSSGAGTDVQLNDGDRIIVPSLGPTVAVSGQVKRPGIYELAEGRKSILLGDIIEMAGGALRPRGTKNILVTFGANGQQEINESADHTTRVSEGDIVTVVYSQNAQIGAVELSGHVRVPGRRALAAAPSIRALIGDRENLRPDPYVPFAALETTDEVTRARRFVPINLERILLGHEDIALKDGDRLFVLGSDDVRFLASLDVMRVLKGRTAEGLRAASEVSSAQASMRQGQGNPEAASLANQLSQTNAPGGFASFGLGVVPTGAGAVTGPAPSGTSAGGGQSQPPSQSQNLPRNPDGTPQASPPLRTCHGLDALVSILLTSRTERFYQISTGLGSDSDRVGAGYRPCPAIFDTHEFLLPFALEYAAVVAGEVRQPGAYPVLPGAPLSSLAALAGGLSGQADLTQVEISRSTPNPFTGTALVERRTHNIGQSGMQAIVVNPGDIIRFNATAVDRDSGPVLLSGEFVRPGTYDIRRGEKISELIQRAGGMTPNAYPYGAIFTREAVRQAQRNALRRAARELNSAILYYAGQKSQNPAGLQQASIISQQLEEIEAIGRVVIEADYTVLQVRPDLDIILEPGDRLFMPKRPSFVMVVGDVLNPGAQQFIAGKKVDLYINQAGGFQRSADEDRTFIVYPNGEAKPLKLSAWNYTPTQVPPGSTVIVPKEPAPFDLFTAIKDTTALVGQIAVTAASLAVISRN